MSHHISIRIVENSKEEAINTLERVLGEIKNGVTDCSEHDLDSDDPVPYIWWTSYNRELEELRNSTYFEDGRYIGMRVSSDGKTWEERWKEILLKS